MINRRRNRLRKVLPVFGENGVVKLKPESELEEHDEIAYHIMSDELYKNYDSLRVSIKDRQGLEDRHFDAIDMWVNKIIEKFKIPSITFSGMVAFEMSANLRVEVTPPLTDHIYMIQQEIDEYVPEIFKEDIISKLQVYPWFQTPKEFEAIQSNDVLK